MLESSPPSHAPPAPASSLILYPTDWLVGESDHRGNIEADPPSYPSTHTLLLDAPFSTCARVCFSMLHTMYSIYLVRSAAIVNASNCSSSIRHTLSIIVQNLFIASILKPPSLQIEPWRIRWYVGDYSARVTSCHRQISPPHDIDVTALRNASCTLSIIFGFPVRSIDCPLLSLFFTHAGSCALIIPPPKPLKHFLSITRIPRLALAPPPHSTVSLFGPLPFTTTPRFGEFPKEPFDLIVTSWSKLDSHVTIALIGLS